MDRYGFLLKPVERMALRALRSTTIHQDQQVSTPLTPQSGALLASGQGFESRIFRDATSVS
jgi:hypothetical protein